MNLSILIDEPILELNSKVELKELDIVYVPEAKAIGLITDADKDTDTFAIEYISKICTSIINEYKGKNAWFRRNELIYLNSITVLLQQLVRCSN